MAGEPVDSVAEPGLHVSWVHPKEQDVEGIRCCAAARVPMAMGWQHAEFRWLVGTTHDLETPCSGWLLE